VFQGVDTVCVGEDECPCDPPADPGQCEKCVDGVVTVYCPEDRPNCCDGVCQAEPCCGDPCDEETPCPAGCECCTEWNGGNPGFLVSVCRNVSENYACCCDAYKKLCYIDMSFCEEAAIDGDFPPDIAGSPPANAILLNNSDALYCDVSRDIGGFWQQDPDSKCYTYGYYVAVDDCGDCEGTCTDWFDTNVFDSLFWQGFCDCATSNSVDVCYEDDPP
jgi:hypothetical protein